MTGKEYLQRVRKHITYVFDRDSIEQELAFHLQDSMDELREEGYSKEEAERLAVERMGSPDEVGKQLNKEHHPVLGYAWLLSIVLLVFLIVPVLSGVGHAVYMGIKTLTPITIENSVEAYSLDMVLELPTHKVRLDNVCVNEDGDYYLTYRAWVKYSYSRAGWSSELFSLEDSHGNYLRKGGYSSSGRYGYAKFEWPENGMLYLRTRDGRLVELNLNEVMQNEEK